MNAILSHYYYYGIYIEKIMLILGEAPTIFIFIFIFFNFTQPLFKVSHIKLFILRYILLKYQLFLFFFLIVSFSSHTLSTIFFHLPDT